MAADTIGRPWLGQSSTPPNQPSWRATSPTWTGPSSPFATCPRWSKGPFSPATRARRRACGACCSTSSSTSRIRGSSTSRAVRRRTTWWRCGVPRSSMSECSSATATIPSRSWPALTSPSSRSRCLRPKRWRTAASASRRWKSRHDTSASTGLGRTGATSTTEVKSWRSRSTNGPWIRCMRRMAASSSRRRLRSASGIPRSRWRQTGPGSRPREQRR